MAGASRVAKRHGAGIMIAGAGIAGIATAFSLAERGIRDVVIVDPRPPLSLTSRRPETNYRLWWPLPAMIELAARSLALVEALLSDGAAVPMDRRGYLYVSDAEATARSLPAFVAGHPALVPAEAVALDAAELHRRWPHLGPSVLGGILVGRAGSLDVVALGEAMLARAIGKGVRVQRGAVTGIASGAGRVTGVSIEGPDGSADLATDVIVDAAGPFAGTVATLAGADLPIETVLRQKVVIRDEARVVPRDAPFTITLDGRRLPWSDGERRALAGEPDGERLLAPLPPGIHVKPDATAGADAVKLGWAWDQRASPPTEHPEPPQAFPRMVLLGAATVIPGLARYADRLRAAAAMPLAHEGGFYARTPDGRPLIGPVGRELEGFFTISGLAGHGAMMAAAAGELAADWITGSAHRVDAPAFDPRRFSDTAYLEAIGSGAVVTGEL